MGDLVRGLTKPGAESRPYRIGVVNSYTAGSSNIVVNVDGSLCTLPCLLGPSYSYGKTVLVARDGRSGGYVVGVIGTAPADPADPVDVPTQTAQSALVLPLEQGGYSDGRWTANASESTDFAETGAFFYRGQFANLGADLTLPYSMTLTMLPQRMKSTVGPDLFLISESAQPAGAVTLNESATGPILDVNQETYWQLPDAWATALLNGTRGGLAVHAEQGSTPARFIDFGALNSYGAQFALTVKYYA